MSRLFSALLLLVAAVPVVAQDATYSVFVDADNNTATGCIAVTPFGAFPGIEHRFDADAALGTNPQVTGLTQTSCSGMAFGAPAPVSGPFPYPIGQNNGVSGSDVVEIGAPSDDLGLALESRLYFSAEAEGEGDSVVANDTGGPIILRLSRFLNTQPMNVPTLGFFGLLLLIGVMLLIALPAARRHAGLRYSLFSLLLVSGSAMAVTIILDGLVGDWAGVPPKANDPTGDSTGGEATDIVAVFATDDGESVFFRLDVVEAENRAPTANDDSGTGFETDEDSGFTTASVLTNDTDPEGDTLTVDSVDTTGTVGGVINNGDGTFDYDPAGQFEDLDDGESATDSFTYTVSDGSLTDSATVTITINGVNDGPEAVEDAFFTEEDTLLSEPAPGLLFNDTDPEDDPLTVSAFDAVSANGGTVNVSADGSFTYDPALNFNGDDTFSYTVSDGDATSSATVTITVGPVQDEPVAVDDAFVTNEDTALNEPAPGVLLNDVDDDGETLTVSAFDAASANGGTVNVNADGSFSYDPPLNFNGDDTFTYTITDGTDTDSATVTITVNAENDPVTAVDDSASITEEAPNDGDANNNTVGGDVLTNDVDPEGGLSVTQVDGNGANVGMSVAGSFGSIVINGDGSFTYTLDDANPAVDAMAPTDSLSDSFSYQASDGEFTSVATLEITINGADDPAVVANDTFEGVGNTLLEVAASESTSDPNIFVAGSVLDNDSDTDSPGLTVSGTSNVTAGAVVNMNADGTFTYTPPPGATGSDSFDYTANGTTGTVTINLNGLVWYVDNTNNGGADDTGSGTSSDPFTSLVDEDGADDALPDDAEDASGDGDIVYVFEGSSSGGDPYTGGFNLDANQFLLGQGSDLVVNVDGSDETLFTGNVANRSIVVNNSGSAVIVDATASDRNGIEITGLHLSGSDNAIDVTSGSTFEVMALIDNNFINDAGAEGIDLNPDGSGLFMVTVSNNAFATSSPTGNAIDLITTGSTDNLVTLAITGNTTITSSTGDGIHVDASTTNTNGVVYITDLSDNTVAGNTAGDGMFFNNVIFDADPTDADFTGDTVPGGTSEIGNPNNPVGGDGLQILNSTGALSFNALTLRAANGTNLQATSGAGFDAAAGTGLLLQIQSGSIPDSGAAGMAAILMNTVDVGTTSLSEVFSEQAPGTGMEMIAVDGSFTVSGTTTVLERSGAGININGGDAVFSFNGITIDNPLSQANSAFAIDNKTVGSVTAASVNITGNGAGSGIAASGNSVPITINGGSIAGTANAGVSVSSGSGNFTYAGSISNTLGRSLQVLNNTGGSINLSGDITDAGTGINLSSNTGATINLSGTLDLDTTTNTAFNATAGGTISATGAGSSIDTTTGTAVNIINTIIGGGGVSFASTSSTGGADGINLTNVGSGAFTTSGGNLANQTDRGVDISGGSGNVTIGAAISTTATGRSVEVTTHTGGIVDFNGFIDDNGLGIRAENNVGGILRFDGGMDIDTAAGVTEEGFQATGGGTVHVTGTNDVNTSAGTGVAVNIADTTIGSDNVTFRNVSANGAANGIILDTTGSSGDFTVSGDGGGTQNASGGTLTNLSGDAISLNNTRDISLNQMAISNIGRHGVFGLDVVNLTMNNSTFNNVGNANDENTFEFRVADNSNASAISGNLVLNNVDVTDFHDTGLLIFNESGSLNVDIDNSDFDDNDDTNGVNAIFIETEGNAAVTADINGGTFNDLEGDVLVFEGGGTGTQDVNLTGVVSTNGGGPDNFPNGGGVAIIATDGASVTFDIAGNVLTDQRGDPITIATNALSPGNLEGRIGGPNLSDGNTISGSSLGDGIQFSLDGSGGGSTFTATILVQNNEIGVDTSGQGGPFNGLGDDGIQVLFRDNAGTLNLTIEDNTFANTVSEAIRIFSDEDTGIGGMNPSSNIRIVDNAFTNIDTDNNENEIELRTSDTADACYHVVGNDNGSGGSPGTINLSIAGSSTASITQASTAALSTDNNGATIAGDAPAFNDTCTNPTLPSN